MRSEHALPERIRSNPALLQQLYTLQHGCCAICKRPFGAVADGFAGPWRRQARADLDHCHNTTRVRGLLCTRCNRNLGWFESLRESVLAYIDLPLDVTSMPLRAVLRGEHDAVPD